MTQQELKALLISKGVREKDIHIDEAVVILDNEYDSISTEPVSSEFKGLFLCISGYVLGRANNRGCFCEIIEIPLAFYNEENQLFRFYLHIKDSENIVTEYFESIDSIVNIYNEFY